MEVQLTWCDKTVNSTLTPTNYALVTTGELKEDTSVMTPSIKFRHHDKIESFNYAYIPEFGRRYFIQNWSWSKGFWTADMKVDTLSSYKTEIFKLWQYVARSGSDKDDYLIDGMYPLQSFKNLWEKSFNLFSDDAIDHGAYVVSVLNSGGLSGGVTYYLMPRSTFKKFTQAILGSDAWWKPSGELGGDEDKMKFMRMLFNPIQYITRCIYLPDLATISDSVKLTTTTLDIGHWKHIDGDTASYIAISDDFVAKKSYKVQMYDHPQQNTYGLYFNSAPYRKFMISIEPFGSVVIDGADLKSDNYIYFDMKFDVTTGNCIISITNGEALLATLSGNIGIEVPITQYAVDYKNSALSYIDTFSNALHGNIAQGARSLIGSYEANVPKMSVKSDYNGFLSVTKPVRVVQENIQQAERDNPHNGSPLMKMRKLGNLQGFTQVINPHFESDTAYLAEKEEIMKYMEGGFYIE